jgi:fatty-acyl-CoA synthase
MSERGAAALAWQRALEATASIAQEPALTFPLLIDRLAETFGDAPALISERETLSYRALADRAARYAGWAMAQGLAPGEVVCLMMPNCPEYLAIWLGVTRIGGVVALINTNLAADALLHAIETVGPRHIIIDARLTGTFAAVAPRLGGGIQAWAHGAGAHGLPRIDREIETLAAVTPAGRAPPALADRALCIYTSGTTGLPKAANVSHYRVLQWSRWFAGLIGTQSGDRMYNCLPMYHSVGGVVAIGAVLVNGGSVVIRERFSASRFWPDVADSGCTLFQYIGELCRYLTSAPPHPRETGHRLRLACGNGLRPDVWESFRNRFEIPRILEFYSSTEGNFSLYNCEGKPGAIGRIPPFLAHRLPVALVKFDVETGEPLRGADGRCLRCAAGEAGEAIGKIPGDAAGFAGRFEGYTDRAASERKILRDVFQPGDSWYRTGDLMRRDAAGYFYFVDRIGDTFRWKGENVSTGEVEEVLTNYPGIDEAVVYGIAIPGADGRAGMAALVTGADFDFGGLDAHLAARLPEYARPVFLRLCDRIVTTGTFKPQKNALARAGYGPAATSDALFVYDREQGAYTPLDDAVRGGIERGELRL